MKKIHIKPRERTLLAALLLVIGTIGAGFVGATAASADTTVHTLVSNVPESWGPYLDSAAGYIVDSSTNITISCYVTGQSVSGPYGSEDVWDLVTGGIEANGSYVETGVFVPDAQVYTGSNSPVVPPCNTALGQVIGGSWVNMYSGPSTYYSEEDSLSSGEYVEIECYRTGMTMSGPYGSENIWDLITGNVGFAYQWIPDALVYTGSNSAVVPPCGSNVPS